jgi:uncharacterized membrane-anchored protein YitT (DUF2179 family)
MEIAELSVGGLLILVMIGVSIRGWLTLPSDARVPVHYGVGSYNNFVSKTAGLVLWPVGGAVVYGIFCGIFAGLVHPHHGSAGGALIIMPILLAVLIAAQVGAIRAANRGAGTGMGLR